MSRVAPALVAVLFAALLVAGTAFAATKVCQADCRGTAGDDRILGSARANTIYGERGDDRIVGRAGDDALKGGDGRDEVFGGVGGDALKGSAGRDEISGGPGDDSVRAGTPDRPNDGARDVLSCGDGTDTAYFIVGQDVVRSDCEERKPAGR